MAKRTISKRDHGGLADMSLTDDEREELALSLAQATSDEDSLFSDTIEQVKKMFYAGDLSAPEAADLLNLSLPEFVDEFIVTDEWCVGRGATTAGARQTIVNEVTNILQRERSGISTRDFVSELLYRVTPFSAHPGVDAALAELADQPLGSLLRREQASGASPDEFVSVSLLSAELRSHFDVTTEEWDALAAEGARMLATREEYVWNALWFSALQPSAGLLRRRLLPSLERALASKNLAAASKLIARIDTGRVLVSAHEREAARLLWCYTRWIPYDSRYLPRVELSLKLFSRVAKAVLCPVDQARLTIIEGVTLFYRDQYEASRKCLAVGESLASTIANGRALLVWCLYFKAKILWKMGRLDDALGSVRCASDTGAGVLTEVERATLDLFEAWLLFVQKDDSASIVLERAGDVFAHTDCHLRQGDVLSASGRFALADGNYVLARRLFTKAISTYARHDSMHRHVARARVNMATTLLRLVKNRSIIGRQRVNLLQQALTQLDQAETIYQAAERQDTRKLAKLFLVRAGVYQAVGELVEATVQIERALEIACALDDNVMMADAKRLQAECSLDPKEEIEFAKQARSYAKQTDDQRLHDRIQQSLERAEQRQEAPANNRLDEHHGGPNDFRGIGSTTETKGSRT